MCVCMCVCACICACVFIAKDLSLSQHEFIHQDIKELMRHKIIG